jgi:hypothetical protein
MAAPYSGHYFLVFPHLPTFPHICAQFFLVGFGMVFAIEALKECRRSKKATMDELWGAAKICRVANVMRPYLESL